MRCLVIGICQLTAIAEILKECPSFTTQYTEIIVKTVFTLTVEEMDHILKHVIPTCDLVLSQPVSEDYHSNNIFSTRVLRERTREFPSCKHLVISNCYFAGYDPLPFQITNSHGEIVHRNGMSYYPTVSFASLLDGSVEQACKDFCNPDNFSLDCLTANYLRSIAELRERERDIFGTKIPVDIPISDFILKEFRCRFLFHTYNHPTNELLLEITQQILQHLGVEFQVSDIVLDRELLGEFSVPPCPSVYFKLQMKFPYPPFIIQHVMDTHQAMKTFTDSLTNATSEERQQWMNTIGYKKQRLQDGLIA